MLRSFVLFVALSVLSNQALAQERVKRNVGSFEGIKASSGVNVYLKKGSKESVEIEVSGIDTDRVMTEVSGGILKVGMESGNYRGNYKVRVYVTFVRLNDISVSSAAGIYSESLIESGDMEISASSAGSIEIEIKAQNVEIDVSSSGDVEVSGSADEVELSASSAGDIDAYDLNARQVTARASSAGSIRITVIDDIDASASSGGSVRYRGNPKKSNTSSSSGGSIHKTND